MIAAWIQAFRLRTLPVALASIGMGTFLALDDGYWNTSVFIMCSVTTCLLQVLSNLANDYGDSIHGADHSGRVGPSRAVQTGAISSSAMRRAVVICASLSFVSGVVTLVLAFPDRWLLIAGWVVIGLVCIAAAITYTAGRKPYGYMGLGDASVILFFGFIAVCGTYFLFSGAWNILQVMPATACGLLAAGVLNINNIRDIESDRVAGKFSLPVRFGRNAAIWYHRFLLWGAVLSAVVYVSMLPDRSPWSYLFLLTTPLLYSVDRAVSGLPSAELDPWLRRMALSTLAFTLLFGTGLLLS